MGDPHGPMTSDPAPRRHFVGTKRDPMWTLWRWPRWPFCLAGNRSKWVRCRKVGYFTNYWRWRKVAVPGNIYIYYNYIILYMCICIYIYYDYICVYILWLYMYIYIICNYVYIYIYYSYIYIIVIYIYVYYVYLLYDLLKPVSSLCQACFKPDWIPWCLLLKTPWKHKSPVGASTWNSCWNSCIVTCKKKISVNPWITYLVGGLEHELYFP